MNLSAIIKADTLEEIKSRFTNEEQCDAYLHAVRWSDQITSPFDPESKIYSCKANRYRCKNTKKYFNVRTNTLFHNSKVPLTIWFEAIWIIAHSPKISSVALAAQLMLTQKTAWYMLRRIRRFLVDNDIMPKTKNPIAVPLVKNEAPQNPEKLNLTGWLELLKQKQ